MFGNYKYKFLLSNNFLKLDFPVNVPRLYCPIRSTAQNNYPIRLITLMEMEVSKTGVVSAVEVTIFFIAALEMSKMF